MKRSGKGYEDFLLRDMNIIPPWSIFKVVVAIVNLLNRLLHWLVPPHITAVNQAMSFIPTAWLCMAAKLGIADCLKDGPKSATQLAEELGVRGPELYRGLRMLVNCGYFEALPGARSEDTLFRNSRMSAVLREDHPNCIRHVVMHWHGDAYTCFGPAGMQWLLQREGKEADLPSVYKHLHGNDFWECPQASTASPLFSQAMADLDSMTVRTILSDYKWGQHRRVLDIGGATGSVLGVVLRNNPGLPGVLFDQPKVIDDARKVWKETDNLAPLQNRVNFVGGSFFEAATIPKGLDGDLYFLRMILHDWSDEESIDILRALRVAIGAANVKLALIETAIMPEYGGSRALNQTHLSDCLMLNTLRGKERTVQQFEDLFNASGFRLVKCHPTRGPMWFIEATAA